MLRLHLRLHYEAFLCVRAGMEGALLVLNELIEMYENHAHFVQKGLKLPKVSHTLASTWKQPAGALRIVGFVPAFLEARCKWLS